MPFSLQNCCTDIPLRSCSAICSRQYALRSSTVLPVLLLVMSPLCDRQAGFGRGVHEPLTIIDNWEGGDTRFDSILTLDQQDEGILAEELERKIEELYGMHKQQRASRPLGRATVAYLKANSHCCHSRSPRAQGNPTAGTERAETEDS